MPLHLDLLLFPQKASSSLGRAVQSVTQFAVRSVYELRMLWIVDLVLQSLCQSRILQARAH